jgi:protein TonB
MAFVDQRNNSRQTLSVTGVILVHVAIGYAFIVGLANHLQKHVPWGTIETYPVPPVKPPPPIKPKNVKPEQHPPLTQPIVKTGTETTPTTITPNLDPPIAKPEPAGPLTPITILQRGVRVKGDRTTWVTTEDYPPEAVRNGDEGRVEITVRVGPNGRVTSCQVTGSSGHPSLDEATCRTYAKRARFAPALAADGTPVESSYVDRVRWQLPAQ